MTNMMQHLIPFSLLFIAICLVFHASWRHIALLPLAVSLVCAWYTHQLSQTALFVALGLGAICWLYERPLKPFYKGALWIVLVLLCLALALHQIPGFSQWQLAEHVQLSASSHLSAIRYHYDKALVGFCLIYGLAHQNISVQPWHKLRWKAPLLMAMTSVATLGLAYWMGYIKFDPKWHYLIVIWGIGNLLITCVAEEAFFRLLLQKQFQQMFGSATSATLLALILSAALFGLAHVASGQITMLLAFIAGIGYALVWRMTGRIAFAVATHFMVNLCHILLFSYPHL